MPFFGIDTCDPSVNDIEHRIGIFRETALGLFKKYFHYQIICAILNPEVCHPPV